MRVLILGATGMLGHMLLRQLPGFGHQCWGTVRSFHAATRLSERGNRLVIGIDALRPETLGKMFAAARPEIVINCIQIGENHAAANDPLAALPVNVMLPHNLGVICAQAGVRLVHISTDRVFSGSRGGYLESDTPDATDLWARAKLLGEPAAPALTLRTSLIGPELGEGHGLVQWFLAQRGRMSGCRQAIFSGVPTSELARILSEYVFPHPELSGVYHLAAQPISKYDLLRQLKAAYKHSVRIEADDRIVVDHSLDGARFNAATGYAPPPWSEMIAALRAAHRADARAMA